jgi:transposase
VGQEATRHHLPDEAATFPPTADRPRAGHPPRRPSLPRRLYAPTLQALLASADGLRPAQIAERFGCASQSVRNAIRAFAAVGADCIREKSHRPASVRPEMDDAACERLRALLHRSPRDFGKPTGLWTLGTAAEVAFAEGITARPVSDETIRQAIKRLGIGWKRAKTWITSPDPAYLRKKGRATG